MNGLDVYETIRFGVRLVFARDTHRFARLASCYEE